MNQKGGSSKKASLAGRSPAAGGKEKDGSSVGPGNAPDHRRPRITIWPEWSDADVNAEKWETSKKEDKRSKSPTVQISHFDDPDGKLEMPSSLKVDSWKRPAQFIQEKVPVVVDTEEIRHGFDLITNNEHLHESEFIRHCISQIVALWDMNTVNVSPENIPDPVVPGEDPHHNWRPWEHIYALCKIGKGPHLPLYNSYGKYVVRLYWMGCWRKIMVDDTIPFDDEGRMLLPSTALPHELWPMLLTKALIKVASLDYTGGNPNQEFGDVSVIQCLTGWIPEAIPLQQGHMLEVWELIKTSIPEWKHPLQEWEKPPEVVELPVKEGQEDPTKDDKIDKAVSNKDMKEKGKEKKEGKDKEKGGKDEKKEKKEKGGKTKDKTVGEEKSSVDEFVIPEKPEVVILAAYNTTPKYPVKVSILGDMADASEKLRQNGLSHLYSHVVHIAQTRSCPLQPPPPALVVPSWKLIRPRKRKDTPHDEPVVVSEEPKQIQCLEIVSPFLNYKASPVVIPVDTHRPKSSLERGGTKCRMDDSTIDEGEESVTSIPSATSEPKLVVSSHVKEIIKEAELKPASPKSKTQAKAQRSKSPKQSPSAVEKSGNKLAANAAVTSMEKPGDKQKESSRIDMHALSDPAGGLAPPSLDVNGLREDMIAIDEPLAAESSSAYIVPRTKRVWLDFDVFIKCFRTLYVYHKPNTYPCNQRYSDLKNVSVASSSLSSRADKKSISVAATSPDSAAPFYLFVDNLAATDILVSYSVLPRWFDPLPPPAGEEKERDRKSVTNTRQSREKDIDKEVNIGTSETPLVSEQKCQAPVTQGSIVAEPYSWKSLVTGQPILRLRTTGTKSAMLSLPPGRHVLKFMMTAPLGYHIHMCSTVNFLTGDEETIMPQLTSESLRFRENATEIMNSLRKCIMGFTDSEQFNSAWADLSKSHCPYLNDNQMSKTQHFETFNYAMYQMLRKVLKENATPEIAFAWRALLFDATTPNILAIPFGSRPDTQQSAASATASHRNSGRSSVKKRGGNQAAAINVPESTNDLAESEKPEGVWMNREPSIIEVNSIVTIQKAWRGYFIRKIKAARIAGTNENEKAAENLKRCWTLIEAHLEENGAYLLREMLKKDPDILSFYSFYKDEWSKISYADYKGAFPDHPSMSWFLIFRDIFYVKEEMLIVPVVQVPVNTCLLHVIDNDTMQELPRVFQKVAPHVYKKNKKGYSFVAEARTEESHLASGTWRLRLIGSHNALPATQTGDVCSNFVTKEILDYYIPNPANIIFRQSVKVREDHLASIQMNTSKRGVYIKLAVLNNEEEVISAIGKGHVVIPAFIFLRNIAPDEADSRRSASRTSNKNSPSGSQMKIEKTGSKSKRIESTSSIDPLPLSQRPSLKSESELAEKLENTKVHKYIIQATVLHNSWPLTESSWRFVQSLKDMEKSEQKQNNKEPSPPVKMEKASAPVSASANKVKAKGSKEKIGRDKSQDGKQSRPPSQQFDFTKPHWTLRVVSDASAVDIEIKKDDERAEEIKAMKKAWEDAQPGRAAKALQSRLKYLNSHTIKPSPSEHSVEVTPAESLSTVSAAGTESFVGSDMESVQIILPQLQPPFFNESETSLTLEPPPSLLKKEILESIDITPFVRKTLSEPVYKDEEIVEKLMMKRQKEIADYKAFREEVEKWREADRQYRNLAKMNQLEQYKALQAALDAGRDRINIAREAIRQRFLEAERLRLEEIALQENALKAEKEAKSPKGRKKSPGSAKKKS